MIGESIERSVDGSLVHENLRDGFDTGWYDEYRDEAKGIERTFRPTVVGAGAEIGPDTRLADCAVGASARVEKTMGREAEIGEGAQVGPFAVLDPGSHVAAGVATGPFHHARTSEPPGHETQH